MRVWRECAGEAHRLGSKFVLVLDEIQKIPRWSETVKGLWDADRESGCPLHVVVLGSAPMRMQADLKESLAGRFESIRATHWSFDEMRDAFGLDCDEFVFYGGYPGAARLRNSFERWRDYVTDALIEPHLERDILGMARVDKPALLRQLLDLGCLYSGQELSYKKMRGQLEDAGHESTLARYLRFLSDAGLVTGLFKHSDKPVLRRSSSPKLNVLNTALMSAVVGDNLDDARARRKPLGKSRRKCSGRAFGQHRLVGDQRPLLARRQRRGRLRATARTQTRRYRSEGRPWFASTLKLEDL